MSATQQFPPRHIISDEEQNNVTAQSVMSHNATNKSGNESSDRPPPLQQQQQQQHQQQQLALPAAGTSDTTQKLEVSDSGDVKHTISFDHLGPVIVNRDGTLSRVHNWAQMTDSERERTMRVLGKRNMLRKEAIMKDEENDA